MIQALTNVVGRRLAPGIGPRELALVAAAMAISCVVVVAYVVSTPGHGLAGDESEYHRQGVFFTMGKLWWSTTPFGVEHASMWKAPAYPAWVGLWYTLLGISAGRVELVQALLLAPATVLLTWLLARRLFSPRVGVAAACVVAVFPLAWEYYGLLFPEALAIPLTTLVLLHTLEREPTPGRSTAVGLLIGVSLLVRPTSFFLLGGVAAAWIVAAGWRRGSAMTLLTALAAVLVVAPWTVRNYVVTDGGFVPISVQDAAAYGTFNEESAEDPDRPYAWRPTPRGYRQLLESEPVDDAEFREKGQELAWEYIKEHPTALPEAFFWNGVLRLWDLRPPGEAMDEVAFQGRSPLVRAIGLAMYYVLLPLAIFGLWRVRHRRGILLPLVVMAILASLAFTVVSGTRYRAPFEPVIVVLAASLLTVRRPAPAGDHLRGR